MSEYISSNKDHLEKNNESSCELTNKIKQLAISGKTLSPDAPVFYPSRLTFSNKQSVQRVETTEQCKSETSNCQMYEDALQELREGIYLLTIDPGDFQQMMPHLASRFATLINNGICPLSILIEEIFDQSICEGNFRYSGARMCDYLSQYPPLDGFKREFILRCQREHYRIMAGHSDESRILDYAFFVGELLVNLKDPCTNGMVPELLQQIGELLRLLISTRTHQSILCCLKLLKLTGSRLDGALANFDEVMFSVKNLLEDHTLPRNISILIASVLEQRAIHRLPQPQQPQRLGESPSSSVAGAGDSVNDEEAADHCTGGASYQLSGENHHNMHEVRRRREEDQYFIGDDLMDDETADAFHLFITRQEFQ